MFIVLLKFSENKDQAAQFMNGHNEWLKRGFDDGVFILSGNLQPKLGGAIMVHNLSLSGVEERVNQDPFVLNDVVYAEIIEISATKTDSRLRFLSNQDF